MKVLAHVSLRIGFLASLIFATASSVDATLADQTTVTFIGRVEGATPFIRQLDFVVNQPANLKTVQFTIQPKASSVTRPLSATYPTAYLSARGFP